MLCAVRTPEVVQTLSEALINYWTAKGEPKEQGYRMGKPVLLARLRERRVRIESKVRGK